MDQHSKLFNFTAIVVSISIPALLLAFLNIPSTQYRAPYAFALQTAINQVNQTRNIYIIASNNKVAKWWPLPQFTTKDIFIFFNQATLLNAPNLKQIPKEQIIIFMRQKNGREIYGASRLKLNEERAETAVFVVTPSIDFGRISRDVQLTSLYHIFLSWDIVPEYPKGKTPSTGFVAFNYVKTQFQDSRIHLVGFSGKGWKGHHFQYEQEMLRSDERVHMIDVVKPDKDIKKDKD